jgi:D-alanine-D-alanine ligase
MLTAKRRRHGGEWFAEAYVEGREFNISIIENRDGPQVLPLAEIVFEAFPADKPRIVGYRAKWEPDSFEYRHTVRRFPDLNGEPDGSALSARMRAAALRCWDIFGLRGYARVDVRVDTDGRVWVLELNANPCLTPDAGFPAAAERAGLAYDRLIERVAAAAQTAPSSAPRR